MAYPPTQTVIKQSNILLDSLILCHEKKLASNKTASLIMPPPQKKIK